MLQGRSLLQDQFQKGLEWDNVISQDHLQSWKSWLKDLPMLQLLEFDRCFKTRDFGEIVSKQLHTLSDASHMGYGAVSYLRFVNSKGRIHCAFVLGKARLAPVKQFTIPRLEINGAATATGVSNMILREINFPINEVLYWTENTCMLGYTSNQEGRLKAHLHPKVISVVCFCFSNNDLSKYVM